MTPSLKEVRRALEKCEIGHTEYASHLHELRRRVDDALDGGVATIQSVVGPSRVGKSMLITALLRAYPETLIDGCRTVSVLAFRLPTPVTPKEMPGAVLDALGSSGVRTGGVAGLFGRMAKQLRLAGTRVLLAEEASHTVDKGALVQARAAADWFKDVLDLDITIILFGLPKLRKLYESNEQFRLRGRKPREFRPYDCRRPEEWKQFASCVKTFAGMFTRADWPIRVPFDALVKHCYLLSGGLVGVTNVFFQQLAYELEYGSPREVTFADCAKVMASLEPAGSPRFPAFAREEVTPQELAAAHAYVLETSELSVRRGVAA